MLPLPCRGRAIRLPPAFLVWPSASVAACILMFSRASSSSLRALPLSAFDDEDENDRTRGVTTTRGHPPTFPHICLPVALLL